MQHYQGKMENCDVKILNCSVRIQHSDGKSEHYDSVIEHCGVTIQHGEDRIPHRGITMKCYVDDPMAHCDSTMKNEKLWCLDGVLGSHRTASWWHNGAIPCAFFLDFILLLLNILCQFNGHFCPPTKSLLPSYFFFPFTSFHFKIPLAKNEVQIFFSFFLSSAVATACCSCVLLEEEHLLNQGVFFSNRFWAPSLSCSEK